MTHRLNWSDFESCFAVKTISDKTEFVICQLLECADTWNRDARLLGNITAGDISDACKKILLVADG